MFTRTTALTPSELKSAIVREPLIVKPETTVMDAIAQMSGVRTLCETTKTADGQLDELYLEARSSCVLVVADERVIGILTERDVVRLSAQQRDLENLAIREVMIYPVVTLKESAFTDLFFAVNLLQQYHIRHIPILDEQDRLVGLLTNESLRQTSRPVDLLRLRLVSEVMTHQVICASLDSSMLAIAQRMAEHRVSSVMIVQPGGSPVDPFHIPVGILTERDIVQFQALGLDLEAYPAQAMMSAPIFAVKPNDSLWVVQQIMEQRLIRRLAVTGEHNELLGIVTQTSLLQALNPLELYKLAESLEEKVANLEAEKVTLLESRTAELERQVDARTLALKVRAEREQLVAAISTQIRSSLSLQTILDTTVEQVRQLLFCDRVNIWQFDADGQLIAVAESATDSSLPLLGQGINDTCFQQDCKELYRQGRIRVVPDIYTTEMSDCHRELLIQLQIRAKILVPLLCGDQLWGLLKVTESQGARDWQPEEVELLQALSVQLAIAIQQAITHQALQDQLIERQQAEARLRESEQRYATLTAVAPVGIFRTDVAGHGLYHNERWYQMIGLTPEAAVGTGWQQGLHPDDREKVLAEWQRATEEKRPFQMEYRFQRPDGTVIWVLGQTVAEQDADGEVIGYVGTLTDISEQQAALQARQRSQEALQKSEAHQRALIHAIPDLIMRINRDGIYLEFIAPPNFHVMGDLHELVGTHVSESLPPELAQRRMEFIQWALQTNSTQMYEQDLSSADRMQMEEVRLVPYGPDEVLVLVRDISDRKRSELERQKAEAALVQSEAQSRAILAAIPDFLFRVCANGIYRGFVTSNREIDFLPEDFNPIGLAMVDVLPPELASRHLYHLRQALSTGELQIYEQEVQVGNRLQDEEVRVVKSSEDEALFMIRDISDRKEVERQLYQLNQDLEAKVAERTAELQEREAELEQLSKRLALSLTSGAIGCWDWDVQQNTILWDDRMFELYGVTKQSDSRVAYRVWANALHPEDRVFAETFAHQAISGEVEYDTEFRIMHADGRICFVKAYGVLVRDAQGNPQGLTGINFDISDRKQAEARLQQTNEELLRATRLKDEFLANMSHELRTPLNAILGMAEGLQEEVFGGLNPQQIKALQTIERSGSHLLSLINDILDVAKIEAGQIELDYTSTGMEHLCQSSLAFIKQQALQKRIQLETKLQLNLPDLLVDERRIRQVLINLLNNAVKFTPEGGRITLEVKAQEAGGAERHLVNRSQESTDGNQAPQDRANTSSWLRVSVIDTGIGIAPENIQKLFQPFIQIDSALNRQYAGTGLGLALVKRIVELHGGRVGLTSELGVGSCFTIELPFLTDSQASPELAGDASLTTDPEQDSTSANDAASQAPLILLAEDNEANISTVSSYLEAKGYRILLAKHGQAAIDLAASHQPDLILMDIQMPGMDGLQAMQQIRLNPSLLDIPIVALTALAMEGDRDRCLAAGANDYLTKPVKLKQLATMIQQLLATKATH